jgi:hypothetical protein
MITLEQYFGRMSHIEEPTDAVVAAATDLLFKVNALLVRCAALGIVMADPTPIHSGWRPACYNAGVPGAAVKSKHITGQAVDISDDEGALHEFLFAQQAILEQEELWMEHPAATKGWCHLQSIPPRSGNRVFFP